VAGGHASAAESYSHSATAARRAYVRTATLALSDQQRAGQACSAGLVNIGRPTKPPVHLENITQGRLKRGILCVWVRSEPNAPSHDMGFFVHTF
jgi:hypothetical protein